MSAACGKVEGMEVGLTLGLENQEGALTLSLMDCGCHVNEISIILDGGASWLYQGYVFLVNNVIYFWNTGCQFIFTFYFHFFFAEC